MSGLTDRTSAGRPLSRTVVLVVLLGALSVMAGCSQGDDDDVVTDQTTPPDVSVIDRDAIFDAIDVDDDGVVPRDDYEAELAARQARERQAELDRAFGVLASERATVVANAAGVGLSFEVSVDEVLQSLVDFPPSQLDDPANPDRSWFTERLENMVELRLVAVALTDLGFAVDLDVSDVDVNQQVIDIFDAGDFHAFARDRIFDDNPELVAQLSSRCISVLLADTEADARAATNRVLGGEDFGAVAAEVGVISANADGTASLGCASATEWAQRVGEFAATFTQLGAGELGEPYRIETAAVDSGVLWAVAQVDDVLPPDDNPDDLTRFGQMLLLTEIRSYDVVVEPRLGTWDPETLSIVADPTA